jgi:type IV pilus assembly protein PilN
MRKLDASDWLENPNLDAVQAAPDYGEQATIFKLSVSLQLEKADEVLAL